MNASGTARPISEAGAVPLSAIAAVGAMIAIDRAIASQKRSSRRRPEAGGWGSRASGSPVPRVAGSVGGGYDSSVKIASGRNAPTVQLGASTISWMRRSTAVEAIAYASSRVRP